VILMLEPGSGVLEKKYEATVLHHCRDWLAFRRNVGNWIGAPPYLQRSTTSASSLDTQLKGSTRLSLGHHGIFQVCCGRVLAAVDNDAE
jgi:hypothetical protein